MRDPGCLSLPSRSDTWPAGVGTAGRAACKGPHRWRSECQSLSRVCLAGPPLPDPSSGDDHLLSALPAGAPGVPRIRSRLPQLLRRAPAPEARVGGGGYSQLRSYFHTPFASPSARRSTPAPPPRPPPLAPGRRPFFTTSQPPLPAALAAMTRAPPPPGFPVRTAFAPCHVGAAAAAAAARQPGTRSPSAPPQGGAREGRRRAGPAPVAQKFPASHLPRALDPGQLGKRD